MSGAVPWRQWRIPFGFATAVGVLMTLYRYLGTVLDGGHPTFHTKAIEELGGAYGWLLLAPAIAWWTRWTRRHSAHRAARLALLTLPLPLVCLLHTSWIVLTRLALFPLWGQQYDAGALWVRVPMEAAIQTVCYGILVALIELLDGFREGERRTARLATVEKELADAKLAGLRAQLHPHFLFNALNTVSSVMYENPGAADRMLAGLGHLLRRMLESGNASEIALADEMVLLDEYLDIMRSRFECLTVRVDIPHELERALVPQLALQPIVENALRHGAPLDDVQACVTIGARRVNGRLRLEVRDNGPGLSVPAERALTSGIGLSNTASRLATLYGADQRLVLERAPEGGCLVALEVPYRER